MGIKGELEVLVLAVRRNLVLGATRALGFEISFSAFRGAGSREKRDGLWSLVVPSRNPGSSSYTVLLGPRSQHVFQISPARNVDTAGAVTSPEEAALFRDIVLLGGSRYLRMRVQGDPQFCGGGGQGSGKDSAACRGERGEKVTIGWMLRSGVGMGEMTPAEARLEGGVSPLSATRCESPVLEL